MDRDSAAILYGNCGKDVADLGDYNEEGTTLLVSFPPR